MFDSFGKPGAGIMEASLSFLGFYSECLESRAPVALELDRDEPLFEGKYCLANMHLSNTAIESLQVIRSEQTRKKILKLYVATEIDKIIWKCLGFIPTKDWFVFAFVMLFRRS